MRWMACRQLQEPNARKQAERCAWLLCHVESVVGFGLSADGPDPARSHCPSPARRTACPRFVDAGGGSSADIRRASVVPKGVTAWI